MLGILGGLGPAATVDFLAKLVSCNRADRDQDHLPLIMWSRPDTHDRSAAILGRGPSPLDQLTTGVRFLRDAGAHAIAIPCNSAHFWLDELNRASGVPVISIIDATVLAAARCGARTVGLLATEGTLYARIYHRAFAQANLEIVAPHATHVRDFLEPAIKLIKGGEVEQGSSAVARASQRPARARRGPDNFGVHGDCHGAQRQRTASCRQ